MKTTGLIIACALAVFSAKAQQASATNIAITMEQENQETTLTWETQREVNSSYFLVEKTTDGVHYTAVSMVKAKGNSIFPSSYAFSDTETCKDCAYRVILVNMEGQTNYSQLVSAARSGTDHTALLLSNK